MAETAIIGKVAVKVIPDTKKFRPDAQAALKKIEKQLKPIKVKLELDDTEGFKAKVKAVKAEVEKSLSSVKANVKADLDQKSKEETQRKLNGMEAEVKVSLSELWRRRAQASLAFLARSRTVDLFPKVNKAFAAKAALTLSALSGGRAIADIGEEFGQFVGRLDKTVPKIAGIALAVTNLGSAALTSSANLFSLGSSLATIGPAALALPGIFGGIAIGVAAFAVSMKDFNKHVPEFAIGLGKTAKAGQAWKQLQDAMSNNFWKSAEGPIRHLIDTLFPQLSAGLKKTSTELGQFTGRFAKSLVGDFNGPLKHMFDDLSKSIRIASHYTDAFSGILKTLGKVGAGYLPKLAQWFGEISQRFDNFLTRSEKSGALTDWIDTGIHALKDLGSVLASTTSTLAGLAKAADAAGSTSLATLAATMRSVAHTVNSADFQKTLANVFNAAHDAMSAISHESGPQFRSFINRLADTLTKVLPKAGHAAGKALGAIFDALDQPVVEKAIVGFFGNLDKVIGTLAPAMRPLAKGLASIVDMIGVLGQNIARGLAPLVEGLSPKVVDLEKHLEPLAKALGDVLVQLVDLGVKGIPSLTGLADALTALLQPVIVVLEAFNKLPGPVIQFVATAGILALTLPKISAAFNEGTGKVNTFGKSLLTAEGRTKALQTAVGLAAGVAGLGALTAASDTSNRALKGLLTVAGDAALGFAAGGPVGLALGAGAGLFSVLASNIRNASETAKKSRANYSGLADTLDQLTGAVTGNTRAFVLNQLERSGSLKNLAAWGISARQAVDAVLGEGAARKQVSAAIHRNEQDYKSLTDQIKKLKAAQAASGADLANSGARTNVVTKEQRERQALIDKLEKQAQAEKNVIDAVKGGIGAVKRDVAATQAKAAAVADYSGKLKGLPKEVKTIFRDQGVIPSLKRIAELSKQYKLTPKQIKTVISATNTEFTVKQVKKVEKGLTDVNNVRPNLSGYKASLSQQIDQAGGIAHAGGNRIGNDLGAGLQGALRGWVGSIARTSADLVSNAIRAARAAADAHSPSRETIRLGQDMGDGLSIGLQNRKSAVAASANDVVKTALAASKLAAKQVPVSDRTTPKENSAAFRHGVKLAEKLLNGLDSKLSQIKNLFAQAMKNSSKSAQAALRSWFTSDNAAIQHMASAFKQTMAQFDKARQKLQQLQQAAKDFRDQTIGTILDSGDPSQSGATTFAGVESFMQGAVLKAKQFRDVLKVLIKEGLNKTTLKQILAAGPTAGLATAQAIQSMGQAGVDELNKLQKQLQDTANDIGKSTTDSIYKSDIAKAMKDVLDIEKQVVSMQDRLEKAINKLIDRLIAALKKNKSRLDKAKATAIANKKAGKSDPTSSLSSSPSGPTSGHTANSKVAGETAGVTVINNYRTLNYTAAPGSSLDAEEDLFAAASRVRMVDF